MPNPLLDLIKNYENTMTGGAGTPSVDLRRIPVQATIPPQSPQNPSISNILPQTAQIQKSFNWGEFFKRLGIPIASTIAGVASPSLLSGAAGLNTGFVQGLQGADELAKERNIKNKEPSKESLLKMAQIEANRQMGGGVFGQAKMASDPKFKEQYLKLVDELYKSYLLQFRESEGDEEQEAEDDIDTEDNIIENEWEAYQGGNL